MMLAFGLTSALSAVATVTLPAPLPRSAQVAVFAYRNCLFDAIDEQDRRATYSERHVISACAGVRRVQSVKAVVGLNRAAWSGESSQRRVQRSLAELDESVWTIVGHLRARHAGR
jgi:hypothetical protein